MHEKIELFDEQAQRFSVGRFIVSSDSNDIDLSLHQFLHYFLQPFEDEFTGLFLETIWNRGPVKSLAAFQ